MPRRPRRSGIKVEVVGTRLRELRESEPNQTLDWLAALVDMSKAHLSNLETGKTRFIDQDDALSIASALRVSMSAFTRTPGTPEGGQWTPTSPGALWVIGFLRRNDAFGKPEGDDDSSSQHSASTEDASDDTSGRTRRVAQDVDRILKHIADARQRTPVGYVRVREYPAPSESKPAILQYFSNREAVVGEIQEMVRVAAEQPDGKGKTILLTTFGDDMFRATERGSAEWRTAQAASLESGWNIMQLIPEELESPDTHRLVEDALFLFGRTGTYEVRQVLGLRPARAPSDLVVVPDHGAALVLATHGRTGDLAMVVRNDKGEKENYFLNALTEHFAQIDSTAAPAISLYQRFAGLASRLTAIDRKPGHRYLIKEGPSQLTMPRVLYAEAVKQIERSLQQQQYLQLDEIKSVLGLQLSLLDERQQSFRSLLASNQYRDLIFEDTLEAMSTSGRYDTTDWILNLANECEPRTLLRAQVVSKHFQEILDLLRDYPRFEIGVIPKNSDVPRLLVHVKLDEIPHSSDTTAKGRVYTQIWPQVWPALSQSMSEAVSNPFHMDISVPEVVYCFWQYLEQLWNRRDVITDRAEVQQILENRKANAVAAENAVIAAAAARGESKPTEKNRQ